MAGCSSVSLEDWENGFGGEHPDIPYACCLQEYSASITAVVGPLNYGTTCPENPITNFLGYASVHFEDSCNNTLDCETQIVYLLC